jgi:cellobiose-specific phosphotransferase system component IIC
MNTLQTEMTAEELAKLIEAIYYEDFPQGIWERRIRFILYLTLAGIAYAVTFFVCMYIADHSHVAHVLAAVIATAFVFVQCEYYYVPSARGKDRMRSSVKRLLTTTKLKKSEIEMILERQKQKQQYGRSWHYDAYYCYSATILSKLPRF